MVGVALLADEVVVVSLDDVELGTGTTTMGPSVEAADVLDVMACQYRVSMHTPAICLVWLLQDLP